VTKTKNRVNVVTSYGYDASGRVATITTASAIDSNILDGQADDQPITDTNLQGNTTFTYLAGDDTKIATVTDGAKSELVYDFRNQVVEAKAFPSAGKTLTSKSFYVNHEKLYDEDPYGRRKYYGYRASDGTLIRTITCTTPTQAFADFAAVWNATRLQTPNAAYIIHDAIRDDDGHLTQIIDGRGIETRYAYDDQGREVEKLEAYGTSLEAKTVTIYDSVGNVVEVRSPRYFDSTDTEGYQKACETWTYTARNLVLTHTEAPSTAVAATESFTYDLAGDQLTHTDFRGFVWSTIRNSCCGKSVASKDPLGHGSLSNSDSAGRAVHTSTLADINDHLANYSNPIDAKTLSEQTTRYDARGRSIATTSWLTPRGIVDVTAPPIAGLDGVSSADGFTTRYLYDEDLTDGVGLDSSTGVSVAKVGTGGTGSFNVSLAAAITKLASTTAQGGAGLTFDATAKGKASVVINAEDEIQFSISDAAGRTVMSGTLNNYRGSGSTALNTLASWFVYENDSTAALNGFGVVLVMAVTDSLGHQSSTWSDGALRILKKVDEHGKTTTSTYDNSSLPLSTRDAYNHGHNFTNDLRGNVVQIVDTSGRSSSRVYDKGRNLISQSDYKGCISLAKHDTRGRTISQTSRTGAVSLYEYTPNNLISKVRDADGAITIYTYNERGDQTAIQYPDHTGGIPGAANYGIMNFTIDPAGRLLRKQDQEGNTFTFEYDLANRIHQRKYRRPENSPFGTVSDCDTFTFDKMRRVLSATSGRYGNEVTFTYDSAGRTTTEYLNISGKQYPTTIAYNTRNEVSSITYPNGDLLDFAYWATGRLKEVKRNGISRLTRSYDDCGRLQNQVFSNGVTENRTYTEGNEPSSISFAGAGSSIGNYSYAWDQNSNKTGEAITGTLSNYGISTNTTYDADDRLVNYVRGSSSSAPSLVQTWSLSPGGDFNSASFNSSSITFINGAAHKILEANGQNFVFDQRGNTLYVPGVANDGISSLAFRWDFDNQLVEVDSGGDNTVDISFEYDAFGRRVSQSIANDKTVFVNLGKTQIADYLAGATKESPLANYLFGTYVDDSFLKIDFAQNREIWLHRNEQYSLIAATDNAGSILERFAYSAYGIPTILDAVGVVKMQSTFGLRHLHAGREWDTISRTYYNRARYHLPSLGRFLSRDPIEFEGSRFNLYQYTNSNPLTLLDPTGLRGITVPQAPNSGGNSTVRPGSGRTSPWRPNSTPATGSPRNLPRPDWPTNRKGEPWPIYRGNPYGTPPELTDPDDLIPEIPDRSLPPTPVEPGIRPGPDDPFYNDWRRQCWSDYENNSICCRYRDPLRPYSHIIYCSKQDPTLPPDLRRPPRPFPTTEPRLGGEPNNCKTGVKIEECGLVGGGVCALRKKLGGYFIDCTYSCPSLPEPMKKFFPCDPRDRDSQICKPTRRIDELF
jgi:RHS repeat-associated protein